MPETLYLTERYGDSVCFAKEDGTFDFADGVDSYDVDGDTAVPQDGETNQAVFTTPTQYVFNIYVFGIFGKVPFQS